jgi:glycosyltransferase involved in cell wall biosynthesis
VDNLPTRRPISLDVVICTYNNAPRLAECLQSLATQQVSSEIRWRVLIVDNNCRDDTPAVVARWAPEIPAPVQTVHETRQGLNPARLRGICSGDGDWIAFIDDDCVLAADWIEQASRFAQEHPDAGAFGGRIQLRWMDPPPPWADGYGYAFAETDLGETPYRRDWLAGAGMVLRRAALNAIGWTDRQFVQDRIGRRLVSGGDVELGLRIAAQFEVWYAPACRLEHVIPPARTARRYLRRLLFGLGSGALDVAALMWTGQEREWWRSTGSRAVSLWIEGMWRATQDLRRRREAFDPLIACAFAAGWCSGMWRLARMGRERHQRLARLHTQTQKGTSSIS